MDTKRVPAGWSRARLKALGLDAAPPVAAPRRVVVGIDQGPACVPALLWALHLGQEVHAVAAVGHGGAPGELASRRMSSWPGGVAAARRGLEATVDRHVSRRDRRRVRCSVSTRSAGEALERAAARSRAQLIVVGHGGKGPVLRALVGSTAQALAHRSPVPVLVAKDPPRRGPVMAALGDDAASGQAYAWAAGLAKATRRRLVLAHASRTAFPKTGFSGTIPGARALIVAGPPAVTVPHLASKRRAALLVVGHGRRPLVLGSVALRILRRSPSSVLVVRAPGRRRA